jgi:hypothetical protein
METTLTHAAIGREEQGETIAMTPLGKLLIVLALLGGGILAWKFGPSFVHARVNSVHARTAPQASPVSQKLPVPAVPVVPAVPALPDLSARSQTIQSVRASAGQTQRDHLVQITVAARAVAEQNRQRIAELDASMHELDDKLSELQAHKATSVSRAVSRAPREEAAASAKTLHANVAAVKEAATVDVAALPVETVSAQSIGITNLTKGTVSLTDGQHVAVGQALRSGETVIAVDPESHAIVTNRRIINVTN